MRGTEAVGDLPALIVGYERILRSRLSLRAEAAVVEKGGFVSATAEPAHGGAADGLVKTRAVQFPVIARYFLTKSLFVSGGGAIAVTLGCSVDQEDEGGTFFGRSSAACDEWTGVPFRYYLENDGTLVERPKVFSKPRNEGSLILSGGLALKQLDLEVRYDRALSPVLRSEQGGLATRTLTMIVHLRPVVR
jgi:hypothetical protein